MIIQVLQNPYCWALLSALAIVWSFQIVGNSRLGKKPIFGIFVVTLFTLGRVILVLPFLPQPRLEMNGWNGIIGGTIFLTGIVFTLPAWSIRPFTTPNGDISLKTTGFYRILRNPIYLAEVLWCLGWSIMFRSIIGVALVPFWWASLLSLTLIEEGSLERELGQPYLDYKKRIRGRIIPGLPI
jgi:protein-S-isoprenylcysteine O-methyltransferase Ste14